MSLCTLRSFFLFVATAALFAACADATEPPVPVEPSPSAVVDTTSADVDMTAADSVAAVEPERLRAFETALDSLDALVRTLERIEGPIAAWNRAGEAARLLRYLEDNRSAFALDMSEAEAARRYPSQIGRLNALEVRRAAELKRINEDPASARVLLQEMSKAMVDTTGT